MNKRSKGVGVYISVFLLLMLMATLLLSSLQTTPVTVKYSEVIGYFERQEIKEFELDLGTGVFYATFQDDRKLTDYKVPNVNLFLTDVYYDHYDGSPTYIQQYNEAHPDQKMTVNFIRPKETPWWVAMLPSLLLLGALIFFYVMMMRQARGGGAGGVMSFGKAKPRMPDEGPKVTFADVAGAEEEKEELVRF